tara:strand:- start:424 stop:1155 length:732 start_codon:yes stop_codon:yes gene_type:complete
MSKIRLYPIDTDVTGGDKVIGTDSFTKATKNFTISDIAEFLNKSSSIDSQTLRYKFQVPVVEPREQGTISFKPNQGDTVNFNTITTFLLSKFSLKYVAQSPARDISSFYSALVGSIVFISNTNDISKYAVYNWDSSTQNATEPNFYDIVVSLIASNGALEKNEEYFISLLQYNPSSTGGDKTFVFSQGTPSFQWDITHNLDKFPSVSVVNSFKETVFGRVDYINKNRLTVTFANKFSGEAYCN